MLEGVGAVMALALDETSTENRKIHTTSSHATHLQPYSNILLKGMPYHLILSEHSNNTAGALCAGERLRG